MSRGKNLKLKLYRLRQIMLQKTDDEHGLSVAEVLKELEKYEVTAERKSIYTDMEDLEKTGLEIICEKRGRESVYHVGARPFELAEVKILIDAIQASRFITQQKSKELIAKLKENVSEYQASSLQHQVYINSRIKNMNESIYYSVDAIHSAIAENKKIKFLYCSWNVNKELEPRKGGAIYKVSPWALTWADENYYLVAYDSRAGKVKHYRVDKMLKISTSDEMRDGREIFEHFDMANYANENFSMYGGAEKTIHIRFPDEKVGIFIDRFGKDISICSLKNGISEIAVEIAVSSQFFGWIFSLGPDVKVTGPEDVVEEMKRSAGKFLENYETEN